MTKHALYKVDYYSHAHLCLITIYLMLYLLSYLHIFYVCCLLHIYILHASYLFELLFIIECKTNVKYYWTILLFLHTSIMLNPGHIIIQRLCYIYMHASKQHTGALLMILQSVYIYLCVSVFWKLSHLFYAKISQSHNWWGQFYSSLLGGGNCHVKKWWPVSGIELDPFCMEVSDVSHSTTTAWLSHFNKVLMK